MWPTAELIGQAVNEPPTTWMLATMAAGVVGVFSALMWVIRQILADGRKREEKIVADARERELQILSEFKERDARQSERIGKAEEFQQGTLVSLLRASQQTTTQHTHAMFQSTEAIMELTKSVKDLEKGFHNLEEIIHELPNALRESLGRQDDEG